MLNTYCYLSHREEFVQFRVTSMTILSRYVDKSGRCTNTYNNTYYVVLNYYYYHIIAE